MICQADHPLKKSGTKLRICSTLPCRDSHDICSPEEVAFMPVSMSVVRKTEQSS
jgi:hypothetical protein